MVKNLAADHRLVAASARDAVAAAEAAADIATADLATERIEVHDKTAWMLEASL